MNKKKTAIALALFVFLAFVLHVYKNNQIPPCLNADEAAFGYNAYSLLKTGKDEYGRFLPLRLKSFGDFKLPLYSYLSVPFVALFGLNEFSVRLLAAIVGMAFPLAVFFLSQELFQKTGVALAAAGLASVSPWLQTISRQAHEVGLAALLITLSAIFLLRYSKTHSLKNCLLFSFFTLLSLFSYHLSRVLAVFFLGYFIIYLWQKKKSLKRSAIMASFFIVFIPLLLFIYSEIGSPATRIQNLIFFRNQGFNLKLAELNNEHNFRIVHNKLILATIDLLKEYLKYFSPEFLVVHGDQNPRFGYEGISPITAVEYLFFLAGLYFLFKKRGSARFFLLLLLGVAPFAASLAWQEYALTRAFYLIVPLLLISVYGFISFVETFNGRTKIFLITGIIITHLFFLFISWDFYFFHYPKRAMVIRGFQCGYKELVSRIQNNYDRFSQFKMTTRHGQPYIFLLFYLQYPPAKYQRQAQLSSPDEYGFGQVEGFDKFDFNFTFDTPRKGVFYVGYPEHLIGETQIDEKKLERIKIGAEEIFWTYGEL